MNQKIIFDRSIKDLLLAVGPSVVLMAIALVVAYKYINPAPSSHVVMATGAGEGDYQIYAQEYKSILKESGINLEIKPTSGPKENLALLQDPNSNVEVGFVQDGLGSATDSPDLESLGSLYYEPLWIFYRGQTELTRFSQLKGKRLAIGEHGGGTPALAGRLLKASGIEKESVQLLRVNFKEAGEALKQGKADVAFFLATTRDPLIKELLSNHSIRLMNVDQAEAITRNIPFLHHLVLPHGAIDLALNLPAQDVNMVATTATLLVRDSLHPALSYLLLKAASQIHSDPGIFEKKNEFPIDKDYEFPLSDEAEHYYKSGTPFWQRYLPFWLATLVDRFLLVLLPLMAIVVPLVKLVPRLYQWRIRSRIYQRYGELKFLETQMAVENTHEKYAEHLRELDGIEERVNHMKVPLDFSDHVYVLREHIDFVRGRLRRPLVSQEKVS